MSRIGALATAYPLLEQGAIGHRDQLASIGQQGSLDRTYFLDLPFDLTDLDLLPDLVQLAHINPGENLPGDFPTAQPQRQCGSQAYRNQHDGDDVVQQVGLDLQLADGHRNTDDDHQPLGDAPQAMGVIETDALRRPAHQPADQLRQQHTGQQNQRGTEDLGQIQGEHVEGCRNPLQAQRLCRRHQKNQQYKPVDDLADQGRHRHLDTATAKQLGQPGARHQAIQTDLAEQFGEQGIEQLGHNEAEQHQDQCHEQVRNEAGHFGPERGHRGYQALGPGIEFHFSQPYQ